ncbi:DNA methyltransferase [Candidatus Velamenicoccus archaeovorus]|uniref:site-specific DNA-methyltransferase (adenine-specific) n=1 Tax=Velamenicoccus archaeovorus TaxID=1930593 RepID=A0A410P2Z7_VELA1|nr:DNA adenine methylase [Candidatus Velamenicoccus archaeovorus]QAT16526.1 DNA methyltransferase [Candidatus Velamenicoccus archaeovorus]
MPFYSPLRYPGGKNKLAEFIASLCVNNKINKCYVEPYAGGASVALYLLLNGYVEEVIINDYDRAIYSFWYSILNYTERFCEKIKNTEVNLANWNKFKNIHSKKEEANLFDLGFATFFLNRTNRSGIITGGPIGGMMQEGKYKIDCRFNDENLIKRIQFIAIHKKNIRLYMMDALCLIEKMQNERKVNNLFFYFDPPYYSKGPLLYMSHYEHDDHKKLSEAIKRINKSKWVVSYDNTREIRELYATCEKREYFLLHTAYKVKKGEEILFISKGLLVPDKVN